MSTTTGIQRQLIPSSIKTEKPSNSLFDLSPKLEDDISAKENVLKKAAEESSHLEKEALKKWQCVYTIIRKISSFVELERWEGFHDPESFYHGENPSMLSHKILESGKYTIFYGTLDGAHIYEKREVPLPPSFWSLFGFKKNKYKYEQVCVVRLKESSSNWGEIYAAQVDDLAVLAEVPRLYEELKQELLRMMDQHIDKTVTANELMKMVDFKL